MATQRYLTKSRFTQGAECAAKLHYSGDPAYFDRRADDGFLQALAEGGFQVGTLARLMVPGGVKMRRRAPTHRHRSRPVQLVNDGR